MKEILGLGPCENFEIVLLDPEHYEDISISLSIPIFIRVWFFLYLCKKRNLFSHFYLQGRYTSGEED